MHTQASDFSHLGSISPPVFPLFFLSPPSHVGVAPARPGDVGSTAALSGARSNGSGSLSVAHTWRLAGAAPRRAVTPSGPNVKAQYVEFEVVMFTTP